MRDRHTVRYITTHYARLHGLRLVPLGVPFLVSAAWRAGWLTWWPGTAGRGATNWFIALVAGAITVSFPIRSWYERQFGLVAARRRDSGLLPLVAFVALVGLATWYQLEFTPTLMVPLLVVGLILALIGWHDLAIRPHYIAIGAAWALAACMEIGGVPPHARPILFDLLVGAGLIVAGVGDHRALTHVLGESHARAV